MRPSLRKLWMTISIKRKIGIFAAMVILIMALSASFKTLSKNLALLLNLILLVLGCIMDMAPIILIATPILLPIATSIGTDPIQFGIMVILNCGIGLLTPPVGGVLFIGSGISGVPIERLFKHTVPFLLMMLLVLLMITYIPAITLTLPGLLGLL